MSCCTTYTVCVSGKTYEATILFGNSSGTVTSSFYVDENLQKVQLNPGTFTFGSCALTPLVPDTVRIVQNLVAGNNIITHNLGNSVVTVEARNNATGADIGLRVVAESANTTTLFVPVAMTNVRLTIRTIGIK